MDLVAGKTGCHTRQPETDIYESYYPCPIKLRSHISMRYHMGSMQQRLL
tara:strand:- start:499 stop:645 length:147 start_codon:yes stop_codon:yes gene_type:complete